jgi:hypothetical protein
MKLALVTLLALAPDAHADCAVSGLAARVLTPPGTVVPGDGGIVVGALNDHSGKLEPGDAAVQPGWRLRVGSDLIKPPIAPIAPGLAVYRVAVANAFDAKLEDDQHTVIATVKPARRGGDALAVPAIKRIWYVEQHNRRGSGTAVTLELAGDAPAGAVALVLADAKGTPRSWTVAGGTTLSPFSSPVCAALPNGTIPSKAGDKVTLFWLGADGRVSPITKPLLVEPK